MYIYVHIKRVTYDYVCIRCVHPPIAGNWNHVSLFLFAEKKNRIRTNCSVCQVFPGWLADVPNTRSSSKLTSLFCNISLTMRIFALFTPRPKSAVNCDFHSSAVFRSLEAAVVLPQKCEEYGSFCRKPRKIREKFAQFYNVM